MLIAILIGNNVVNISAAAIATLIATELWGGMGPGIAVGVLTIIILIFGEITKSDLDFWGFIMAPGRFKRSLKIECLFLHPLV